MADDKKGRDKQARNAEKRARKRDLLTELERKDETEPDVDEPELNDLEAELETLEFPTTGSELVDAVGDQEVDSVAGTYTVEELVSDTDAVTFDSPADVRMRVQRPTVAAAMKRTIEASETLRNTSLSGSQYKAYEKTFRALRAIDADDDDEGIEAIADWIVEQIRTKEKLPGSRAVRREAAKFCRKNGYEVRNDEWLGI